MATTSKAHLLVVLALLLVALAPFTQALTFKREFGPIYTEKTNPRALNADIDGNFIEFADVNGGCGGFDRLKVTGFDLSAAAINSTLWSHFLPCGSIREYLVASYSDPVNGGVYFLTTNADSVFVAYKVTSAGIVTQGTFTDVAFSQTNIGVVFVQNMVIVYNEDGLRNLDGTVTQLNGANTFWAMTSDGTTLYILASTAASSGYFVAKGTYNAGSFTLTDSSITTTIPSPSPLRADVTPSVVTFFHKSSIYLCDNKIYVTFTGSSGQRYETFAYTTAPALHGSFSKVLTADDAIIDFRCNKISGRGYALVENLILNEEFEPVFSYNINVYYHMVENGTVAIEDGDTTTVDPRYIAVVASPLGSVYIHREKQQAVGTFSEIYGQIFTNCGEGTYGPDCLPCLCVNGVCDSGEGGLGNCLSCNSITVFGPYCNNSCACVVPGTPCSNGINGNGECDCQDPQAYGFNCEHCQPGYFMNNLTTCEICPVGYYCVNSTRYPCEGNYVQGLSICNEPTSTPEPTTPPPTSTNPTPSPSQNPLGNTLRPDFLIAIILGAIFAALVAVLIVFGSVFYHKNFRAKPDPAQDFVLT